jgi:hypothetical protein
VGKLRQGNGETVVEDGMVGRTNGLRRETCPVQDVDKRRNQQRGNLLDQSPGLGSRIEAPRSETIDAASPGRSDRTGVRASVVAKKRGNARGAKGRREVEA